MKTRMNFKCVVAVMVLFAAGNAFAQNSSMKRDHGDSMDNQTDACEVLKETLAQIEQNIAGIKEVEGDIQAREDQIQKDWNQVLWSVGIGIPASVTSRIGFKYFASKIIVNGELKVKNLIEYGGFGVVLSAATVWVIVASKDLWVSYDRLSRLHDVQEKYLNDQIELRKTSRNLRIAHHCP